MTENDYPNANVDRPIDGGRIDDQPTGYHTAASYALSPWVVRGLD